MSLRAFLQNRFEESKDKVFIYFKDRKVTYGKFGENVYRIANGLLDFGVKPRNRVCIMMPNCPEWLQAYFALNFIGASPVPVNIHLKWEGLKYIIDHSEATTIFIDTQLLGSLEPIRKELPHLKKEVCYLREGQKLPPDFARSEDRVLYSDLLKGSPTPPAFEAPEGGGIMYTSGTTGPPKGVVQTRSYPAEYYVNLFMGLIQALELTPDDVLYTCLPLYHGNALGLSTNMTLFLGASLALSDRFSASRFWDEVRKYNAAEFNALGSMLMMLYKQPPKPDDADNPVRVVLSAATPAEIWRDFEKRFNLRIVEGYALVDCPGGTINLEGKVGSMGKATPPTEMKIVDENDKELPPNTVGEIIARVPGTERITAYYKMEKETKEAWRGGWFHTGDLGYVDEEGWFYFAGRKKHAIRRRGENISSWEIERVVDQHPKVLESAAVGVPSELGEEDVMIFVVLKEGEKLKPDELLAFCEERMAYFKVPRYIEFRDSFPKTGTQRIRRSELKKGGVSSKTWDREKAGYKLKKYR